MNFCIPLVCKVSKLLLYHTRSFIIDAREIRRGPICSVNVFRESAVLYLLREVVHKRERWTRLRYLQ